MISKKQEIIPLADVTVLKNRTGNSRSKVSHRSIFCRNVQMFFSTFLWPLVQILTRSVAAVCISLE